MAKGTMVELQAPHGSAFGYVMGMVHGRGRPGVVVLHDEGGLGPHVKDVVNRFAHEGYDALALDLLHGRIATSPDEMARGTGEWDEARALAEVRTAIDYLSGADRRARVGLAGFGIGGACALRAADHPAVASYVSFYGFPTAPEQLGAIHAPGLILCGEQDREFPMAQAVAFVQRQTKAGIATEMAVHARAGYGFFDDTHADRYQAMAARTSWSRTLAIFNRHVKGLSAASA
jgi:carboxymethylenebutenolidase